LIDDRATMLPRLPVALTLMGLCVVIHATGVSWALQRLRKQPREALRFWGSIRLFVLVSVWIVLLHLAEISVWAAFYLWRNAMPDLPAALYFSAVTYTTTGYGDVVLAEGWRLLGAVEALTGILMCGWSTGFFFAIVNRIYEVVPEAGQSQSRRS
jgi:voltage-gated potassium channel Kch